MAKTQSQIIDEALRTLNALAAGQTAEAEDVARFDLISVAKYLNGRRIVDLSGEIYSDDLGDEFFLPFSMLAAAMYGKHYGLPLAEAAAMKADALRDIRAIVNRAKPVIPLQFERMAY